MENMDSIVEQLHQCLADAIRRQQTRPFEAPVTVAEIYQDLVPYRNVRSVIGFEMNADYEHTVLRLLAGEGDFARLEPDEAREELAVELASANPNVGLFRKFAGCDVWVTPRGADTAADDALGAGIVPESDVDAAFDAWENRSDLWRNEGEPLEEERDADAPDAEPEDAVELLLEEEVEPGAPAEAEAIVEPVETQPKPQPEEVRVSTPAAATENRTETNGARCAFCDSALPHGRDARFCPWCGVDQAMMPCASCGEALENDWLYCLACGTPVPKPAATGA